MALDTSPYLSSASALIKALKSPADPPQESWPSKIEIAKQAWSNTDLYVPRKSEVLGDWILETWSRKQSNGNTLLVKDYHDLLIVTAPSSSPPLTLISNFFQSINEDIEAGLVLAASRSFEKLFGGTSLRKAEAWVEVWTKAVTSLGHSSGWRTMSKEDSAGLLGLVHLILKGVESTLPGSPNRKKISQSALTTLPAYASALSSQETVRKLLQASTATIYFSLPILQVSNPFQTILAALPSDSLANLEIIPHLLESYISTTHSSRYPLFTQPSSSKLPLDVFVSEKVRSAVRLALSESLRTIDSYSEVFPLLAIWKCREQIWEVIKDWGGYVETENSWGELVQADAQRATSSLVSHGGDAQNGEESLASAILRTLVVLETLDHGRTDIDTEVVGWCLACPAHNHIPAHALLSSLLRFHHLTHSLPAFFALLTFSVQILFPVSLSSDVVTVLYTLIANGPLTTKSFENEIKSAVRSVNVGGRRGPVWSDVLQEMSTAIKGNLTSETEGKKRKRGGVLTFAAAISGILSRPLRIVLDAAAGSKAGPEEVENVLAGIMGSWDVDSELDGEPEEDRKKTKKSKGNWSSEIVLAGKIRSARAVQILDRRIREEDYLEVLKTASAIPEVRLEIAEYLIQNTLMSLGLGHSPPPTTSAFIDSLLDLLAVQSSQWSGRAAVSETSALGGAIWEVIAERGLVLIDLVSTPDQLKVFIKHLLQQAGSNDLDQTSASSSALRILSSAETWELSNIRSSLLHTLVQSVSSTAESHFGIFTLLNACPATYLSKNSRTSLLEAAYTLDEKLSDTQSEARVHIREWLARLAAETDVLGPLASNPKLLKRLAKSKDDSESSRELIQYTMALLGPAYSHICKSGDEALMTSLLEDSIKAKPFSKWAKRLRKDESVGDLRSQASLLFVQSLMRSGDIQKFTPFKEQLTTLSGLMIENLHPAVEYSLQRIEDPAAISVFEAWKQVSRFHVWVSPAPAPSIGDALLSSLLARKSVNSQLAAITLDLIIVESFPQADPEKILASFIALSTRVISDDVDQVYTEYLKSTDSTHFAVIAQASATHLNAVQHSAVLHAIKLCISVSLEGSGKTINSISLPVLNLISSEINKWNESQVTEAVELVECLVENRAGLLQPTSLSYILQILLTVLLPSQQPRLQATSLRIFSAITNTLLLLVRHRSDLLGGCLPSLVAILDSIFPLLQKPRLGNGRYYQESVLKRWPFWLANDNVLEDQAQGKVISRLLVSLTVKPRSSNPNSSSQQQRNSKDLSSPLAKHAPSILLSYCRSVADPISGLSANMRKDLESGMYALCEIITVGGRADGRGREGEGVGIPYGLGEKGEAEREVWAGLWTAWSKKRYVGQG